MATNDNYRIQAMNRKQAEREARRETMGNDYKFDNLNGGRIRPEYLDELEKAQKDSYNHTVELSDGFKDWLDNAYKNQREERQEVARRVWESMQPSRKQLSDLDQDMHEQGNQRNINLRKNEMRERYRQSLFPDAEIERRRDENESKRHPMDVAMREKLREKNAH